MAASVHSQLTAQTTVVATVADTSTCQPRPLIVTFGGGMVSLSSNSTSSCGKGGGFAADPAPVTPTVDRWPFICPTIVTALVGASCHRPCDTGVVPGFCRAPTVIVPPDGSTVEVSNRA